MLIKTFFVYNENHRFVKLFVETQRRYRSLGMWIKSSVSSPKQFEDKFW
jgi:hypothetical protein